MINYFNIITWTERSLTQANKPTKWQKFMAWLRIRKLPDPKYWIKAEIVIEMPHPLKVYDTILLNNGIIFMVMTRLHQNNTSTREAFLVESREAYITYQPQTGQTVILGSTYSEFDKSKYPYTPKEAFSNAAELLPECLHNQYCDKQTTDLHCMSKTGCNFKSK